MNPEPEASDGVAIIMRCDDCGEDFIWHCGDEPEESKCPACRPADVAP